MIKTLHPKAPRDLELFAQTENFALNQAVTANQRLLLKTALKGLRSQMESAETPLPYFTLPLLVYGAIAKTTAPAEPLAVACGLLFLGIDIHDDLADGDLPKHWRGYKKSQINLAAATLTCSLPQIAISKLKASPDVTAAMQHALAQGLLRMSAGQERDIAFNGKTKIKTSEIEESVANKSGEELALFARLTALLAGAPPKTVATYSAMARAMGTAGQLASDCHDIFQAKISHDLANGTRTLPIALYLEKLDRLPSPKARGTDRQNFLALLKKAQNSRSTQIKIRRLLMNSGVLRHCAFIVEIYCQRALSLLKEAQPMEPFGNALISFINSLSYFSKNVKFPEAT